MLSVQIDGVKGKLFDSAEVMKRLDKGERKALSKCGAFVRTSAKGSLRYAKKSATAGQPPKVHRSNAFKRTSVNKKTGKITSRMTSPLKELIFFAAEPESKRVVVGPMQFGKPRSYRVPAILEGGGTTTERTPEGLKVKRYPGNPFMKPALNREMPKFQGTFANII